MKKALAFACKKMGLKPDWNEFDIGESNGDLVATVQCSSGGQTMEIKASQGIWMGGISFDVHFSGTFEEMKIKPF